MLTRRQLLKFAPASLTASSFLGLSTSIAKAAIPKDGLVITSVSWIDAESLPSASVFQSQALIGSWPYRVVVGLTGTQNPRPSLVLEKDFRSKKQFRAMTRFKIDKNGDVSGEILDPGYTPPFEISKVGNIAGFMAWASDDGKFHAGAKSSVSAILKKRLHPSSTLEIPDGAKILASALIKFRAGAHTNSIGLEKANSPYHVPWVWCEHALILHNNNFILLANGSRFPSHSWYINGNIVGTLLQSSVSISVSDPALSTGAPSSQNLPSNNEVNIAKPVDEHQWTVSRKQKVPISLNLK